MSDGNTSSFTMPGAKPAVAEALAAGAGGEVAGGDGRKSPLELAKAAIAAERAKIADGVELTYDLPAAPGVLAVRYAPLTDDLVNAAVKGVRERDGEAASATDFEIAQLIAACKGVYLVGDDGELVSADVSNPTSPPPRFDERLNDLLDLKAGMPEVICRAMYNGLDGTIHAGHQQLAEDSGYGARVTRRTGRPS